MRHPFSLLIVFWGATALAASGCDSAEHDSQDATIQDATRADAFNQADAFHQADAFRQADAFHRADAFQASDAFDAGDASQSADALPPGCSLPSPAGCDEVPCPAGESCVPGGGMPLRCTCDSLLDEWTCELPAAGGRCTPDCELLQPSLTCCRGGRAVPPLCAQGVFTCPEDANARAQPACGAFERVATPGLICSAETCDETEGCCFLVNATKCYSLEAALDRAMELQGCSGRVQCDDAGACPVEGEVCCAGFSRPDRGRDAVNRNYIESDCRPAEACVGPSLWSVCNRDADCGAGESCCASIVANPQVSLGLCVSGPC